MRSMLLILAGVGLMAATSVQACPACGDKLAPMGGGVGFDRLEGPPGRIVVLAEQGSVLQSANADLNLVAVFKKSGHDVTVVSNEDELEHAVHEHGAEVVVAHWSEAATTAARLDKGEGSPTIVAVSYRSEDAAAASAAGAGKCVSQAEQRKGRKLTDTIDKVIAKRRKGEPAGCPVLVASTTP